jgi:hypothetical protein
MVMADEFETAEETALTNRTLTLITKSLFSTIFP